MWNKTQEAQAAPEIKDFILMAYDPSLWISERYLTITKEVPNAKNVKLSGTFISKVLDGPYNDVPKWINIYSIMKKQPRNITFILLHAQMC